MAAPKGKPPRSSKGAPPTLEQTASGIDPTVKNGRGASGTGKLLTFNIDPETHLEMKTYATSRNLSMKELLLKMFDLYKQKYP